MLKNFNIAKILSKYYYQIDYEFYKLIKIRQRIFYLIENLIK